MENNENENIDSLNDGQNENQDSSNTDGSASDSIEALKAKLEAETRKNAQLFARMTKAEQKAKQITQETKPAESSFSRDEAILIAKGYSEEDIEDMKFIAQRYGKSIREAETMSQFKAIKANRDREAEEQAASLRASQGSKTAQKVTFATADDDEHKKLFKEKFGR